MQVNAALISMVWCAVCGGLGSRSVAEKICSGDASKFCSGALQQEACGCFEASRMRGGFQGGGGSDRVRT